MSYLKYYKSHYKPQNISNILEQDTREKKKLKQEYNDIYKIIDIIMMIIFMHK